MTAAATLYDGPVTLAPTAAQNARGEAWIRWLDATLARYAEARSEAPKSAGRGKP